MKKQLWLNIALFVVIIVLVFMLVYLSEQSKNSTDKQQRLFKTKVQEVYRIVIEREGRPALVLAKEQQWLLVKPALAPVNGQRVQHLLTILNEPIQSQLVRKKGDLEAFKFTSKWIKLTINDEEIIFGMTNPITNNRYVFKNEKIYTIQEIVYGTLGSSVTPLLQHHLLPKHFQVIHIEAPASFYKTPQALEEWTILQATNIADYSANETILGIVSLTIQNNEKTALTTLVLDILAIKPTLIVGRADLKVKYTIDKIATERLLVLE